MCLFTLILSTLLVNGGHGIKFDVYLQLMQLRTSLQVIPYRSYELRWEVECTTDDRQPITKFPTAFSVDDSRVIFYDNQHSSPRHQQEMQNFIYVRDVREMAVVCFRLYFRNEIALEDCLVVDVRTSDFADVRYATKTRAHGNSLTYQAQITPSNGLYMLLLQNDNNNVTNFNATKSSQALSGGCVASTVIACIEAILILFIFASGLVWYTGKLAGLKELLKEFIKRRPFGSRNKLNPPHSQQKRMVIENLQVPRPLIMNEQHYKAPSASSADSGLSTLSNGSCNKQKLAIYDDPPEFHGATPNTKKRLHSVLTEMWRRNRSEPPPPPVPDYRNRSIDRAEISNVSQSLAYDIYAALEDPNNWDPPEQFLTSSDPDARQNDAQKN